MAKDFFYITDNNGNVKKVTDVYIGEMGLSATSYITLTNLVPAINSTSWHSEQQQITFSSPKYSASGLSIVLNGTSANAETTVSLNYSLNLISGHKYYIRGEVYFENANTRSAELFFPVIGGYSIQKWCASNTWTPISKIDEFFSNSSTVDFRFDYNNANTTGVMYVDGIMLIDLTEAYGDNIPDISVLDSISFFLGTKQIPVNQQEILMPIKVKQIYGGSNTGDILLYENL